MACTAPKRVALGFLDDPLVWLCQVPKTWSRLAQANRWFTPGVHMGHQGRAMGMSTYAVYLQESMEHLCISLVGSAAG